MFSAQFNEKLRKADLDNPYGDGFFAEKTLAALKDVLQNKSREELLRKKFVNLKKGSAARRATTAKAERA